jgi:hypothetical protein
MDERPAGGVSLDMWTGATPYTMSIEQLMVTSP